MSDLDSVTVVKLALESVLVKDAEGTVEPERLSYCLKCMGFRVPWVDLNLHMLDLGATRSRKRKHGRKPLWHGYKLKDGVISTILRARAAEREGRAE